MEADEVLVQRVRQGEVDAFDELYQRYHRRLYSYILRYVADRDLAEDLLQEAFIAVLRDRGFDLEQGRFGGWLFTVARNACLTHLRDTRRRETKACELETLEHSQRSSPEEQTDRRQKMATIQAALTALPEAQQDALILKQVAELTYGQIAQILGVPEGTIKSRLHLAIKELRRRVATQGEPA